MKPFSHQLYGPAYIPYTIGVSGKNSFMEQKISVVKLRPGYHVSINIIPKILEASSAFNNLNLDSRRCRLPHETQGFNLFKKYTRVGCEIECAARKATSICRCLPWNYPNNFTLFPICDMFGGYCFNEIMSNVVYYKKCKSECLEECQETSLLVWSNTVPLDIQKLCKGGIYFDSFFKQRFAQIFAFESYRRLIEENSISNLATSLSNGSLCMHYLRNYVSFVSVESPTKSITKSMRDKRASFIDQLGTIGGTLGVCAGMSVLSMIEVLVFVYIVLVGAMYDLKQLKQIAISYLGFVNKKNSLHQMEKCSNPNEHQKFDENDIFDKNQQDLKELYVSANKCFNLSLRLKGSLF